MENERTLTKQFMLTVAAGKRLIAKSMLLLKPVQEALENNTLVIVAGTTNGYIAEEILEKIDERTGFSKKGFYRGINLPPSYKMTEAGTLADYKFPGDVVIRNGKWERGKTIFDVIEDLKKGDIIIKGANALDLVNNKAAIYIGNPKGGTIMAALQAVVGRRAGLILPVGLEKRVCGDLDKIALKLNSSMTSGPRLLPVNGNIITELEAINILTGAQAELVAAGGVCGAEGCIWLAVSGSKEQLDKAQELINSVRREHAFEI